MPTGNPFTNTQAPAYSLIAPDIATQQMQLARQQQLADMLRSQALQQDQGTQVINGWAVKKSPWEAAAKMAQALMGGYVQKNADERQLALAKAMQGRMSDVFDSMAGAQPASAAPTSSAPTAPENGVQTLPVAPPGAEPAAPGSSGAAPSAPLPSPTPPMSQADRIRNQAKAAYWMGNTDLANKLLENISTMTDAQKIDSYLGITPGQAREFELAKRKREGYIAPTRLGEGAYADSNGNVQGLPTAAPKGYINIHGADGQWTTVPVSGGVDAVQESEKAQKLGQTLGTLGQGFDKDGNPAYFIGIPPGTVGTPPASQNTPVSAAPPAQEGPSASAPKVDLMHMTPTQKEKFMAQARAQFDMRPGSEPGRSIVGPDSGASTVPTPVPPNGSSGVVRPGNAPGFNDYQQGIAKAASDRYSALLKQAQDSPARVNVLDNILDLSKAGVATGPNADWNNKIKGIAADTFGIKNWKGDVSNYQEMMKFMTQNASRAWQAAGGTGTDAQLSQQVQGNVNSKMFPQAVQAMAKYAKAGELALQGMTNAMQAANIADPKSQQQFETTWRQNMDPRIYLMKLMEPAEAQAYVANLKKTSPADYQALMKKAQILKQMGGL